MNRIVMLLAVVALVSASAMAQQIDNKTYQTTVNVTVAEEVSMWASPTVSLTLNGKNAENSDAVASTISHINNVAASISVTVDGDAEAGALADVNFYIFDGKTAGEAVALIAANANAPAGALKWTAATLGATQTFAAVAKSSNVSTRTVAYAAAAPNVLPDPDAYQLVVTWTIAPQ